MNDKHKQLLTEYSANPTVERLYNAGQSLHKKRHTALKIRENLANLKSTTTARYRLIKEASEVADNDYNEELSFYCALRDSKPEAYVKIFDWLCQNPKYTPYLSITGGYADPDAEAENKSENALNCENSKLLCEYIKKPTVWRVGDELRSLKTQNFQALVVAQQLRECKSTTTKEYRRLHALSALMDSWCNSRLDLLRAMRDFDPKLYACIVQWLIENPTGLARAYFSDYCPVPPR